MTDRAAFPPWVIESIADDAEQRADRIEALFGADAAAESRDIAAELRAGVAAPSTGETT